MKTSFTALRALLTIGSGAIALARQDLSRFANNVLLRGYALPGGEAVLTRLRLQPTPASELAVQDLGRVPRRVADILPSTTFSQAHGPARVLMYLNNSIPFTRSGYTVRTQSLLQQLRHQGVQIVAATRFGYPSVVGKIAIASTTEAAGVIYHRLLPWWYPRNVHKRFAAEVDAVVALAEKHGTNILHTTVPFHNAEVVSHAAQRLGIPWIYEVRGEPEKTWLSRLSSEYKAQGARSDFYRMARLYETEAMTAAASVIALSEVSTEAMVERGVERKKITVIPNALDRIPTAGQLADVHKQAIAQRKALGLADKTLVGTVSSIVGYEGLDLSLIHI